MNDALVKLLAELVDIPSVSRDEQALTAHLRELIPSSLKIVHDEDSVLVAMPNVRSGRPLIVLCGHTDTVPISNNLPSRIENGLMFGCGTCDMKAGIASMIKLAEWWDTAENAEFDLGICLFGREEIGEGANPLPHMFDTCPEIHTADLVVVMEPTSNAIEVGCQGIIDLELTFKGRRAHTARPWMGENAAHKAIQALQEFTRMEPNDVEIDGLVFREVASVVFVEGGVACNVLPSEVRVHINIRYAPNRLPEEANEIWTSRFRDVAEVRIIDNVPPAKAEPRHPLVQRLLAAGATAIAPKQAWTNVADFTGRGISAVNFGAGDPSFAHREDERLEIAALVENYRILRNFFEGPMFEGPIFGGPL